jgi:hypothetical protein
MKLLNFIEMIKALNYGNKGKRLNNGIKDSVFKINTVRDIKEKDIYVYNSGKPYIFMESDFLAEDWEIIENPLL